MLANIVLHVPTQNVLTVRVKELKKKHHQHRRFFSNTFFSPMHVHILKQEEIRQEPELMQNLAGNQEEACSPLHWCKLEAARGAPPAGGAETPSGMRFSALGCRL